jgi:hypothetical protein
MGCWHFQILRGTGDIVTNIPTTQCACAEFSDFAKQRNGGGGRENVYCSTIAQEFKYLQGKYKM